VRRGGWFVLAWAWAWACAAPALADEGADGFDTKHIFGFTEGTDINAPDEHEAEFVTRANWVKRGGGLFRAASQQATAEGAFAPRIGYEFGLHGAATQTRGVAGLDPLSQVNFSGLSAEPKFVLLARTAAQPVSVALSVEWEWERIDSVSGRIGSSFEWPVTLMADVRLTEKLYAGANLLYAPERQHENGTPVSRNALFGATAALTWRLTPQICAGGEVEAYAATQSLGLGAPVGTAFYLGPTVFARLAPNLFVAGAWSAQVGGRVAADRLDDYNQTEFSRQKARLTIGVAL